MREAVDAHKRWRARSRSKTARKSARNWRRDLGAKQDTEGRSRAAPRVAELKARIRDRLSASACRRPAGRGRHTGAQERWIVGGDGWAYDIASAASTTCWPAAAT